VRLSVYIGRLPDHTHEATTREWQIIDELEQHIEELDERIRERVGRLGLEPITENAARCRRNFRRHHLSGDRQSKPHDLFFQIHGRSEGSRKRSRRQNAAGSDSDSTLQIWRE
jgi:hypothetical protein